MSKINQKLTVNPSSATVKAGNINSVLEAFAQQFSAAKNVVWHLPPIARSPLVDTTNALIGKMVISKKSEHQDVNNHLKK